MSWYDSVLHNMADHLFAMDVNMAAYPLAFVAGLLTNLCPCNIALVPMVIGHAGGFSRSRERGRAFLYGVTFSAGVVVTLCLLGALTSVVGSLLLPLRAICLWVLAVLVAVMGLHTLGVVHFRLPGFSHLSLGHRHGLWGTFLLGLAGGVVAAPCTTPVLATILAYVAVQARVVYGLTLLLVYSLGFVVPLVLAGAFTGFILNLDRLEKETRYREWIARISGIVLLLFAGFLIVRAWTSCKS